ncbi:MAG: hypothetical protein ACOC9I_01805, partial [Actinomycetota bacterium]
MTREAHDDRNRQAGLRPVALDVVAGRGVVTPDRPWEHFLSERDEAVFRAAGYGHAHSVGVRPVLVVVDVTVDFVGDRPEPVLDSIERFPNSCGDEGWEAMARLAPLLTAARARGVPVVYTTN